MSEMCGEREAMNAALLSRRVAINRLATQRREFFDMVQKMLDLAASIEAEAYFGCDNRLEPLQPREAVWSAMSDAELGCAEAVSIMMGSRMRSTLGQLEDTSVEVKFSLSCEKAAQLASRCEAAEAGASPVTAKKRKLDLAPFAGFKAAGYAPPLAQSNGEGAAGGCEAALTKS